MSRQCATQVWIQSVPLHHTLVCTSMANISGEPVNLPDLFCSNRACCLHWSCICTWLPVTAHAPGCQSPQSRLISMKWLEQSLQAAQRQKLVVPAECLVDSRAGLTSSQGRLQRSIVFGSVSRFQVRLPASQSSPVIGTCKVGTRAQAYQCLVTQEGC